MTPGFDADCRAAGRRATAAERRVSCRLLQLYAGAPKTITDKLQLVLKRVFPLRLRCAARCERE